MVREPLLLWGRIIMLQSDRVELKQVRDFFMAMSFDLILQLTFSSRKSLFSKDLSITTASFRPKYTQAGHVFSDCLHSSH